jgi:ABC-type branched-subunit amino acid transport system substrate-binding protein
MLMVRANAVWKRGLRGFFAASAALSLAACNVSGGGKLARVEPPVAPAPEAAPSNGPTIGTGSVRVALLLPLTGPGQSAAAAQSMRNAAELAMTELHPDFTILVKDDRGTADGAREAAQQAVTDGAELIMGPLFASSVQAAGQVARQAGKPVIAFSTDAGVASRGVYLLSFLPQPEVDRVVDYASGQGKRSFAALIPETTYGSVVEAQFREAAARRGARVVAVERYASGQAQAAVGRIAPLVSGAAPQADALFMPDTADGLTAVGQALQAAGYNPQRVKPIGTGVWNDPRAYRVAALQGGWFAAPDSAGFQAFSERYRARFNAEPARLATLSYDAVSLAAALARTQGSQRFTEPVLTSGTGFNGADGVFRFKPDGGNDRGLAVHEVRSGAVATVSPAPKALAGM